MGELHEDGFERNSRDIDFRVESLPEELLYIKASDGMKIKGPAFHIKFMGENKSIEVVIDKPDHVIKMADPFCRLLDSIGVEYRVIEKDA